MLMPLVRLALLTAVSALPSMTPPAGPVAPAAATGRARYDPRRDTANTPVRIVRPTLTADLLTHFIALKQALQTYWNAPAHQALFATAQDSAQEITLDFTQAKQYLTVFDYPTLVTRDTALAALFTANHVTPQEFLTIQAAVVDALGTLFTMEDWQVAPPASTTKLGNNVAVVKRYREALAAVGVSSTLPYLLTATQVIHFIAVKKALRSYWQAPAHAPLLQTAKANILNPAFVAAGSNWWRVAHIYDFPKLIPKDTALAALFTTNHFAADQFAGVQVAVWQAMMELLANEASPGEYPLPDQTTVVGKNVVVIKEHRQALEGIGIVPFFKIPPGMGAWAMITIPGGVLGVNAMEP